MHAPLTAHRKASLWLLALLGCLALLLAAPALSQAEESNPNNLNCLGSIGKGDAGRRQRRTAGRLQLLLQRADHGLPAAVPDPRDGHRQRPLVSALAPGATAGPA